MCFILNIETATTVCSVSLAKNGDTLAFQEVNNGYSHAENLHVFIDKVMQEAGIGWDLLSAIAVSKGPGSYTGLRIGVSAAKGFAYALGIPLIGIHTLKLIAAAAQEKNAGSLFYCPMIDARRMEVYTAVYNAQLETILPVEALILSSENANKFSQFDSINFSGNGMLKCRQLLSTLKGATFTEEIHPTATHMSKPSYIRFQHKQFEEVSSFEPFYLKEFMLTTKGGIKTGPAL